MKNDLSASKLQKVAGEKQLIKFAGLVSFALILYKPSLSLTSETSQY